MVAALDTQHAETCCRNATMTRLIVAGTTHSDSDTLHSDELCSRSHVTLELQAQLDGLSNSLDELYRASEPEYGSRATPERWPHRARAKSISDRQAYF